MSTLVRTPPLVKIFLVAAFLSGGCREKAPSDRVRVSGQVEATEVQVSSQVAGRVLELRVAEGDRVARGDLIARLDTADAELGLATSSRRSASDCSCRPSHRPSSRR